MRSLLGLAKTIHRRRTRVCCEVVANPTHKSLCVPPYLTQLHTLLPTVGIGFLLPA